MKVGDYVRTKEGYICKILKLNELRYDDGYLDFNDINSPRIYKPNVVKSSPNIIDLIEVGDYVNGIFVEGNNGKYLDTLEPDLENSSLGHIEYYRIWGKDIKSIVTKEQFEQMEYKVGEIE